MGLIQQFAGYFPAQYYRYAMIAIFSLAGLSKLIPAQQRTMTVRFPFLPAWTWNTVAIWELGLVVIYQVLGYKTFALNMSYMVMGGALWATCFQSKKIYPVSILRQSYGVALIPPLGTCLLTSCIAHHDSVSLHAAPLAVFAGIVLGAVLTGKK